MAFDYEGAINAGYTPAQIADYLAKQNNFDIAGARKTGYDDFQIITHLNTPVSTAPTTVERSKLREIADVPLKASEGVVAGVRMIADAFGANNPVSKNLRSVENYIADLYSAQSKADSQKIAEIMKEAEDKGVGANLRAAFEAFKVAPVDLLTNALGTSAPTILGGLGAGAVKLGSLGVRGTQLGLGAATGAGVTKGAIYDSVKQELANTGMPPDQIEARAQLAQEYQGKNLDQILAGTALGGIAGTTGIESKFLPSITNKILGRAGAAEARGVIKEAGIAGVKEAIPEALQGGQEQLAQNIALQREGFDVPTMRGVVGQGALEGLAGFGVGAPIGAISQANTNAALFNQELAEQDRLQQELAPIEAERARIAGIARAAQQEAVARQQAEEKARQDYEASLRVPLTQQPELDLAPETTVEEVAAQRAAQSPQGDLFVPEGTAPVAPAEVTPEFKLDDNTIKSFGFTAPKSKAFKTLQSLNDPAMSLEEKQYLFEETLKAKGKLNPKQTEAVAAFERYMAQQLEKERVDELRTIDDRTVGESPDLFGGPDTTELPGRTGEPVGLGVDGVGTDVRATEIGADESAAPLEEAQAPESTEVIEEPVTPRMTAEERQQRIIQQRAEEEAARREEREANLAAAKAEQAGFREAEVLPEAEREGLQAAQEFEQAEANYENAKNTAGAFIRQTFGGAENIAPEERVSLPEFLSALADIMYHIIRKGASIKTEAIQQARDVLGDEVNDFQLNKAFAEAKKRIDAEDKIKEAPPPTKAEEQAAQTEPLAQQRELREETTGDNIFRELVSPRVKDARLNLGAAVRKITPKLLSMYQLVDQFGAEMPALQQYSELNDKMTMTQQRLKNKAHSLLSEWGSFSFKNPVMHKKLGKLMLDATRSRIHPDEDITSEANAHLTSEDTAKYEELSNAYNALSPEAKQIYQRARALLQENFELRRTTYNDMVRGAYTEDLAEATPEEAAKINARIDKAIGEHELLLNEMRGPYFPLMRFGEYLVVAESDELRSLREDLAEAEGAERKRLIEMLRQMEQSDEHYQVHAFEKRSEQAREAERLKRTGMNIRETKSEDYMSNIRANSFGAIDQLEKIFDREIDLDVDPAQMRQLRQAMIDSVLAGLPENSALQRQIKRRNIAGATENMLQAFAETMERDSHYLSRMGYMKPLSKSLIDMRNQSKNDMQLRDIYNNVRARMNLDMRYDNHPILSKLSGISSIYHLGIAPSYLLQNMTQPFMITVPQLAGRYGAAKASKAVIGAWKDASKAVKGGRDGKFFSLKDTDLSNSFSGGELKMVQMLQDLGKLDIANNMDTEVYTKGMSPKMIKFWNMFNWSSHNIELMNRLSSALAAYRLEKGKGSSDEGAVKAARDAVELTQLDYSDTNAAYFMKQGHMGGMNRIPMQFRKYQQGMVYLLARNFKNAWGGDKEAKKAFFYLMGTQLLMAGVRGVPVAAPLLFLMGAFGDDDDKEGDLETQLRNALADSVGPDVARVFWKGLPAMMGLDSGSMSMENLFLPFPMMRSTAITDAATGKDAVTELMFNLGGAPVSMVSRFGDAVILGSEGDYQKALEKVLPKFMSSLVKAERLGDEGITTRSGNVAIEADEFDAWDQAIKALGFTPTKESEYYQAMYEKERISSAIDDRRNRIIKAIATGRLKGEDTAEAREQAREFNIEHPSRRITGESITRSVAQRRKDKQQRNESGVRFEKRERDIRDVTRFAN
jgi:hypothetical protein